MRPVRVLTSILLGSSSLIFLYTAGFGSFSTLTQRALHWTFMTVAAFLLLKPKGTVLRIVSWALAAMAAASGIYVILIWPQRIFRLGAVPLPDQIFGLIAIAVLLIALRLTVGWGLTITAGLFLAYAVFGPVFPGFLGHSGVALPRLTNFLYMTAEGIFGVALGISATYIIIFVIFGAVLSAFGGGQWFVDVAYAVAGRFRGGPAKTAIVASALMGTISGAPVANVATTGTFTIPLMKRVGYKGSTAAAIEAVASTGGMFLPPVMGAGAFIMAEYLQISYLKVAIAAIVPAVLYYVALFVIADSRAAKLRLLGLPADQLPSVWRTVVGRGYHGIPLVFLIAAIIGGWSPLRAAFWSTLLALGISLVASRKGREWLVKLWIALVEGSKQTVPIAMACAGAGIIVGVLGVTGLSTKIAGGLIALAGGNLLLGLVFTMVAAIILGAGMPVTAVYIILAATLAQPLTMMGISPLAAHFFIFMFSAVAGLTPPVAITAYTAAGIAKSDPNRTSIEAFLFGLPGYIIPFMLAVAPSLLLQGETNSIVVAIVTATIGVLCLVAALEGYLFGAWGWIERGLLLVAALMTMVPETLTDVVGICAILAAVGMKLLRTLRARKSGTEGGAALLMSAPTDSVDDARWATAESVAESGRPITDRNDPRTEAQDAPHVS